MTSPNPNEDVTPLPVWDGEGEDPWLPARLQSLLDASTAERSIYEVVWDALSSWLVATTRRVLRGPVIDTDAIMAQEPAWQRRITQIILEGILPVMAQAYQGIFGREYDWRERPNVIQYLIGVRNRLSREPQEVFDLVAGQIAAGVTLGEGMPELRDRVDEVLSTTKSARWKNRAVVIARTESLGALNGSRADAFQAFAEEGGEGMERMWLSTIDSRTRPSHVLTDGQRVGLTEPFIVGGFPLMFPGDPSGPAGEVIQCRCTTLLLEIGENVDMSRRQLRRR
jgi:hypothetical protein